jgi:hypothetical protein
MPRQNRVTPLGEIVALPQRGRWMGNRGGCLHDNAGRLGKSRWKTRAWLICRLQFKGWHREVMRPGRYTELFFLDEATALAAGHRPCALCRRDAFDHYRDCVASAFGGVRPGAPELDRRLHAERLDGLAQRRGIAKLRDLPDGAMVVPPGSTEPWLVWRGALHRWTPSGYAGTMAATPAMPVAVLTPALSRLALSRDYAPQIDGSIATSS